MESRPLTAGRPLALAASLAFLAALLAEAAEGGERRSVLPAGQPELGARARFSLPKAFNFEHFKRLFKKRYLSLAEELARQRIFLAQVFRAFISAVAYKHRRRSHYLSVNHMSDWTPREVRALYSGPEEADGRPVAAAAGRRLQVREAEEEPAASGLVELERALGQVVERRAEEPGYAEIAAELGSPTVGEPSGDERQLPLDRLLGRQLQASGERHSAGQARIASNNPHYKQPELVGRAPLVGQAPLPPATLVAALTKPGAPFLSEQLAESLPRGQTRHREAGAHLPDKVHTDLRATGCFLEPRSQGNCGSCYIFSTISLFEWLYCMETGKQVAFSEQYPLDCGGRLGMKGCAGGHEAKVGAFVDQFGLELAANYPYVGKQAECPYGRATPPSSMGYLRLKSGQLVQISRGFFERFLKYSPILVALTPANDFHLYGGGVDEGRGCANLGVHALLLVGSGREDGKEYWLFRNSHSVEWGERGYYKLSKAADCWADHYGYASRLKVGAPNNSYANPNYNSSHLENALQAPKKLLTLFEAWSTG